MMDSSSDINTENEFSSEMIALFNIEDASGCESSTTLKGGMTFLQAFGIYINAMIGSAVLVTPSLVAAYAPNMFIAICVWLLAGGMSFLAALCFCEIVLVIKKVGSQYIFLYQCYGKLSGYVIIWIYFIIIIPFGIAIRTYTIGVYGCAPFFADHSSQLYIWASKLFGLSVFYIGIVISIFGVSVTSKVTYACNIIMIVFFLFFCGIGIYYVTVTRDVSNLSPEVMLNHTWSGLKEHPRNMALAISYGIVTMDGWSEVTNFIEEINNPSRNIPLLVFTAIPLITIIYVVITVVSLLVLTQKEMASSIIVITTVVEKAVGKNFAWVVTLVAVTCGFSGMISALFNHPRYLLSAAREGQLPSIFCLIDEKRRTPVIAMLYIVIMGTITTLFGEYVGPFLQYYNAGMWIQYGMAITTVIYLRRKLPNFKRSYRVWITTPIVVVFLSIILVILFVWGSPLGIGLIMITILLGFPVYYVFLHKDWCSSFFPIDFAEKVGDALGLVKCTAKDI